MSTTLNPCKHLSDYKLRYGLKGFNMIQKWVKASPYRKTLMEKSKSEIPRCSFCCGYEGRLYICLICSSMSCSLSPESNHALLHTQNQIGHEIAVDIQRSELYCIACDDQVYDPDFDRAVMCEQIVGLGNGNLEGIRSNIKRKRLSSEAGLNSDFKNLKRVTVSGGGEWDHDRRISKSCFPVGLRAVKNVVGPAIEKFQDVPGEVLKFVDRKVDEVLPSSVKDATTTAKSFSTEVVSDVKNNGLVETAKELLVKIEPVAEEYASSAWETLSQIPLLSKIVNAFAPAATLVADKYNETVQQTAEEGYKVSSFLPLVPTEKIAKVFTIPEAEPAKAAGGEEAAEVAGGEEAAEVPAEEGETVQEE